MKMPCVVGLSCIEFDCLFECSILIAESVQGPHEERLIDDIFNRYNKLARPAEFENQSLEVKFGISLQQIIDVVSRESRKRDDSLRDPWLACLVLAISLFSRSESGNRAGGRPVGHDATGIVVRLLTRPPRGRQ